MAIYCFGVAALKATQPQGLCPSLVARRKSEAARWLSPVALPRSPGMEVTSLFVPVPQASAERPERYPWPRTPRNSRPPERLTSRPAIAWRPNLSQAAFPFEAEMRLLAVRVPLCCMQGQVAKRQPQEVGWSLQLDPPLVWRATAGPSPCEPVLRLDLDRVKVTEGTSSFPLVTLHPTPALLAAAMSPLWLDPERSSVREATCNSSLARDKALAMSKSDRLLAPSLHPGASWSGLDEANQALGALQSWPERQGLGPGVPSPSRPAVPWKAKLGDSRSLLEAPTAAWQPKAEQSKFHQAPAAKAQPEQSP